MNFFKKIKFSIVSIATTSVLVVDKVFAQGFRDAQEKLQDTGRNAGADTGGGAGISDIVGTAIQAVLTMVGLIFLILMVYAGFLWMTARGDSDQVERARSIIINAVIGTVLTASAYAITYLVQSFFFK